MVTISVAHEDVSQVKCDVLVLKYAQAFYSADEPIYLRLVHAGACAEGDVTPKEGEAVLLASGGCVAADQVLFVGTSRLRDFRYQEVLLLGQNAIKHLAKARVHVERLAITVHGVGIGLDIVESLRWMVLGIQQGLTAHPLRNLKEIIIVERSSRRYEQLKAAAAELRLVLPASNEKSEDIAPVSPPLSLKPKRTVFVAMPFSEHFEDVYQFGIYQPVRSCGFVCEKVDESVYAGSIIDAIIHGIENASFVIADLTEERPNVYLEVGYAWGLKKPVILVARKGQTLHFDLSHHKCLFYSSIKQLSEVLEATIRSLFKDNI